jgi:acyl-CoA synthetase (AMP-forming)/AMP-acid ligase II
VALVSAVARRLRFERQRAAPRERVVKGGQALRVEEVGGTQVVAVVVSASAEPPDAEDLVAFCHEQLASYKKPRRIVFVEALPRNALGKV